MARKVVTITHPDGTKKIVVGSATKNKQIVVSNETPVKSKPAEEDRRPKPGTPAVGLTKQRNGYKRGGKIKFKTS